MPDFSERIIVVDPVTLLCLDPPSVKERLLPAVSLQGQHLQRLPQAAKSGFTKATPFSDVPLPIAD